jgi:two-component sensor histidine kinase
MEAPTSKIGSGEYMGATTDWSPGVPSQEAIMSDNFGSRTQRDSDKALLIQQSLKYAEDLARIYEEEKRRRKALEKANEQLNREVQARKAVENELVKAHGALEHRVKERTRELSQANERLQVEVARRMRVEEHLKASLKEKDVLLSEIHHRVKNNLQIISSLLALQATRVHDEKVQDALSDCQNRVRSIALIHERLYRSRDVAKVDFGEYMDDVLRAFQQTHLEKAGSVAISTHVDEVHLGISLAIPCSLIINELVTNCLKHAFPGDRHGVVNIEFHRDADDSYVLTVRDDGVGLPPDLDHRTTSSLGLQLVVNLTELQLRGTLQVVSGPGTTFTVRFRDPERR